ncbi:MAG: LytR C-terminal domain-containing protein [Thermoleophilia bacterium]
MTTDTTPTPPAAPDPGPHGRPWLRPVVLVVSCLVIGFVGGWIIRGDEGTVTVLPPTPEADAGSGGTVTTPGGGGTTTTPPATTEQEPPAAPPERGEITVAVLNGTTEVGLAASTAGQAESLGYVGVTAGNAPTQSGPDVVYFRVDQRPAARRVARDLQIDAVRPFPGGGRLGDEVPEDADVIVVLGPG